LAESNVTAGSLRIPNYSVDMHRCNDTVFHFFSFCRIIHDFGTDEFSGDLDAYMLNCDWQIDVPRGFHVYAVAEFFRELKTSPTLRPDPKKKLFVYDDVTAFRSSFGLFRLFVAGDKGSTNFSVCRQEFVLPDRTSTALQISATDVGRKSEDSFSSDTSSIQVITAHYTFLQSLWQYHISRLQRSDKLPSWFGCPANVISPCRSHDQGQLRETGDCHL
ncbi:hypothetical protein BaRGS_00006098, partial [Batillaria attramentaria]